MAVVLYTEYGETDSVHVRARCSALGFYICPPFSPFSRVPLTSPRVFSAGGLAEIARRQKEAAVRSAAGCQRRRRQGHGKEGQISGVSASARASAGLLTLGWQVSHTPFCPRSARVVEGARGAKTKGGQAQGQDSQGGAGDGIRQEQMEELCQQGRTGSPSLLRGGFTHFSFPAAPLSSPPHLQTSKKRGGMGSGKKGSSIFATPDNPYAKASDGQEMCAIFFSFYCSLFQIARS